MKNLLIAFLFLVSANAVAQTTYTFATYDPLQIIAPDNSNTHIIQCTTNRETDVLIKFRSGNAGGVKYVDGMYIEIAVSGLGANTPFNNILEKLFVQEFAKKYNIEPRSYPGIKMLYKRQYLDVEII